MLGLVHALLLPHLARRKHLHRTPVIGQFAAAIETHHVSACKYSSFGMHYAGANRPRKTVVVMRATKNLREKMGHIRTSLWTRLPVEPERIPLWIPL